MSYESFGGGAYGNSNGDYEGNPFSDHSGGFSNNDERVIDFEHSNDQPDNMRANGAYDGNEPSWHQRLSQGDDKSFMDDNNSQDNRSLPNNNNADSNNLKTSLLRQNDDADGTDEDDRLPGRKRANRRKSMVCCDRKQAKYGFFVTNLSLAALVSIAIFSWSLVQNLGYNLNIGTTANDPTGCINADKCLNTEKLLKDNKCAFQYNAVESCASGDIQKYDQANKWPTPVKLSCSNFPENEYFTSPWPDNNSEIRIYSTIGGFLLAGIYYMMAKRCDCCVQFSLTLIEFIMYVQAIIAIIACVVDNIALGTVNEACSTNFKINKYINKKLTSIEICSLSGNGLKCDLSEFYWLSFANLLLAVLWVMSGMSLRSYRKHKNNVPALK